MAIITLPTITTPGGNTGYAKTEFLYHKLVGLTESEFTLEQQVIEWPGDAWEVSIELPSMNRAAAAEWIAFLAEAEGGLNTFYLGPDGEERSPRGNAGGTPLVDGASQTGKSVLLKGWTGTILRGDYIQINHTDFSRLYMAIAETAATASIGIRPALRSPSPANSAACTFSSPVGLFRLAGTQQSKWSISDAQLYGISFKAIEAI